MNRMLVLWVVLAGVVLGGSTAWANAPAPWYPCDGLDEGDRCGMGQYYDGYCELQSDCDDDPATTVNECLWCADDPNASKDDGSGCSVVSSRTATSSVFAFQLLAVVLGLGLILARRRRR